MTLNAELYEYAKINYDLAVGFKMLVHQKNELPLIYANGFAIMPGMVTSVGIRKTKV